MSDFRTKFIAKIDPDVFCFVANGSSIDRHESDAEAVVPGSEGRGRIALQTSFDAVTARKPAELAKLAK